jgi:hypothetical protein
MGLTFAVLFFFGLFLVWVLLAFLPGLNEIQRKTDAKPLPIAHDSEVDIRYLAQRFRAFVKIPLSPILERCQLENRNEETVLEDGTPVLLLGKDGAAGSIPGAQSRGGARHLVLSAGTLDLPPKSTFPLDLYSEGSIEGANDCTYRAILAEESIRLGPRSTTLRWMHAGRSIQAAPGCRLLGRVSADGAVRLASGCRFVRLHAPRIEFGAPLFLDPPSPAGRPLQPSDVPHLVEAKAGRWLVKGTCKLGVGKLVTANLVATGGLEIGRETKIEGSIKSHKDMVLSRRVIVNGSVVSGRSLEIAEGCQIRGPIIAEENLIIGARCVLGTPDCRTTVTAKKIFISPGVICHGTVWAHEEGLLSGVDRDEPFVEEPIRTQSDRIDIEQATAAPAMPFVAPAPEPMVGPSPESIAVAVEQEPRRSPRHPLPLGLSRPTGPLTVGPAWTGTAAAGLAELERLQELVDQPSRRVDPRALPVPRRRNGGPATVLVVAGGNGRSDTRLSEDRSRPGDSRSTLTSTSDTPTEGRHEG